MHRARLVRLALRRRPSKLPIAVFAAVALFADPRVVAVSSITPRILIDPTEEHTG